MPAYVEPYRSFQPPVPLSSDQPQSMKDHGKTSNGENGILMSKVYALGDFVDTDAVRSGPPIVLTI
jgi:hypothetical protein